MPRIVGVDIPERKPIRYALRYIHGIGPKHADEILERTGIDPSKRAFELSENEIAMVSTLIDSEYVVEGALRRQVAQNISRLREIRCYKGDRHRRGLPVHGQRTKCNARTRKGRKKTVAGKKGVKG
ncbi:MAG: 30S ribosomal protein S13 [Phycisphaeraceae bacterium]|nr:MAG: 30S ribosomal protein S13 [Phycisphaeraceae bacterium]